MEEQNTDDFDQVRVFLSCIPYNIYLMHIYGLFTLKENITYHIFKTYITIRLYFNIDENTQISQERRDFIHGLFIFSFEHFAITENY